jgi:hypothetical protein
MTITKGEYCQFSLNTRRQLLKEFGKYVCQVIIGKKSISIFQMHGFYVELVFNEASNQVEKIQPIHNNTMLNFYLRLAE